MHYLEKVTLINEDSVTCAIYFNKLVNVLLNILQSPKKSPFGKYYVMHYFKRIEFQHRGSPHAHTLLWLANAPNDALSKNKMDAISLINHLISISSKEASGQIKLQTHKHSFTCYKRISAHRPQKCRFEAPFMPSRSTEILLPMQQDEIGFDRYVQCYKNIRINLENNDYENIDSFYQHNNISSDDEYRSILRAGIKRPRVFIKREPSEKWHNPFNPFVLNLVKSNMDIQFITEEYSCAQYVAEYVNKTNRGISNLQREIIKCMDEHPEFDVVEITRKLGVEMLNSVEISNQEAAWYLLREPMSKSSSVIVYIPTMWPDERQKLKKTTKELDEMGIDDDSTDIWKENWFTKYEKRPEELSNVTLAQFVAYYNVHSDGNSTKRQTPRILRYRNYDMSQNLTDYKREMVTLHIPFRNENEEILAEMKFTEIYTSNENLILQRRQEFESNLDIQKTIEICRDLCREDGIDDNDEPEENIIAEQNPFQHLYNNPNAIVNDDIRLATLHKLGLIAKRRENLMANEDFYNLMRMANEKQKRLLLHVISHLLSPDDVPFQIFFTGPAGCGKTFVIKLLMEIYNRYTDNDGYCNAYITCASTGKAAVAIEGTTVHTALKISLSRLLPLSNETAQQYRTLFKYVKVIIIDEISMISAQLLIKIDCRLKQITGNFQTNFGGLDIIFIGDLRQLPPVRATPIYKQPKQTIVGPVLWRNLKFYELDQVMRQANQQFSSILTKIGNGERLDEIEIALIESRFCSVEEATTKCPQGIRLFNTNHAVTKYNNQILNSYSEKIISTAKDVYSGCTSKEQETFVHQKLHKMSLIDTNGLPYQTTFVINIYYMITTNIDVSDGLANGAVGKLVHVETDNDGVVKIAWLEFPELPRIGEKLRRKAAGHAAENNISRMAVPIVQRSSTIPLNNNKTIVVKRSHIPLVCACATTIHKSQGSTFPEIVYEYGKHHSQSLLYVALSRVTSIEGLYITTTNDDKIFYHGRRTSTSTIDLQTEFKRLSLNKLETINEHLIGFMNSRKGLSLFTFNCQSLRAHTDDLNDSIVKNSNVLVLSETWLNNESEINIPNFSCIAKFKRSNTRAGGVGIFHNSNDVVNIVTSMIDFSVSCPDFHGSLASAVGDLCMAQCQMENGKKILIVALYISPNQKLDDIIDFLHHSLLPYTKGGATLLRNSNDKIPMILSGDFNVNFALDKSLKLVEFLRDNLNLCLQNSPQTSTTRSGTTIDAVFTRLLESVECKTYISYFSYHKPLITKIFNNDNNGNNDAIIIDEIQ